LCPSSWKSAFVIRGRDTFDHIMPTMEQFDASSGQWSSVPAMCTARMDFGAFVVAGDIFVSGGVKPSYTVLSSVERYSTSTDTWSTVSPLPEAWSCHAAVAVGLTMFVLGGYDNDGDTATSAPGAKSRLCPRHYLPVPRLWWVLISTFSAGRAMQLLCCGIVCSSTTPWPTSGGL
jgi:non-specific serine/threonine protein kinase